MKLALRSALILSFIAVGAFACSSKSNGNGDDDDDSGGGDGISTSVSGDLKDLSEDDVDTLCGDVNKAFEAFGVSVGEKGCSYAAAKAALEKNDELEDDCESAKETCLEDYEKKAGNNKLDCSLFDTSKLNDCDATVDDLTACMNAYLAENTANFDDAYAAPTCSELKEDDELEGSGKQPSAVAIDSVKECKALKEKCPDLAFTSGGSGGTGDDDDIGADDDADDDDTGDTPAPTNDAGSK